MVATRDVQNRFGFGRNLAKNFDFFILEFLVQNAGLITSNLISTLKLEMASWIVAKLLSSQSSIYFYVKF